MEQGIQCITKMIYFICTIAPLPNPQLDIGDLFAKLVSAGIINKKVEENQNQAPEANPLQEEAPVPEEKQVIVPALYFLYFNITVHILFMLCFYKVKLQ
jgi:hypothetical protein